MYGPIGLKPKELYELTPGEVGDLMDGYKYKSDREYEMKAWEIAWLIRPHVKKPIQPAKILPKFVKQHTVNKKSKRQADLEYFKEWARQVEAEERRKLKTNG